MSIYRVCWSYIEHGASIDPACCIYRSNKLVLYRYDERFYEQWFIFIKINHFIHCKLMLYLLIYPFVNHVFNTYRLYVENLLYSWCLFLFFVYLLNIYKSYRYEKDNIFMDRHFVGCTILAAGFVYFINPYNLVPGGVYGASIVLHNLFPSIQVGTFGLYV